LGGFHIFRNPGKTSKWQIQKSGFVHVVEVQPYQELTMSYIGDVLNAITMPFQIGEKEASIKLMMEP